MVVGGRALRAGSSGWRTLRVRWRLELLLRFDHGASVPWLRPGRHGFTAVAGPDAVELRTDVPLTIQTGSVTAEFTVWAGQKEAFVLSWHPSHLEAPAKIQPWDTERSTTRFWKDWSERCM